MREEDRILIRQYYDSQEEMAQKGAFYTINFIDEDTVRLSDGTERELSQDDVLTIEYEGQNREDILQRPVGRKPAGGCAGRLK